MKTKSHVYIWAIIGAILATLVGYQIAYYNSRDIHIGCTVTTKESLPVDGGHQYRVYSTCGEFEVTDDLTHHDSADIYASITTDKKYNFATRGWRIPALSAFPNIIESRANM